jgi:ABC-type antimicrobial peptide transport system permease subunit
LTRTWLTVYFPASQFFHFAPGNLAVRTAGPSEGLLPTLHAVIRAQDPQVAIYASATMETLLARELARPRTALAVTALFGAMAIFLAAVGAYGVLSYEVTERGHELAVRSAIGASPARIFNMVVRRSLWLGSAGVAIGLLGALLMAPAIEPLLFEVGPFDPGAFAFGAGFVLGVGLLAALIPARRAAGTDPAILLRAQ